MAEQWQIKGDFIDFCKCAVPCPCSWGQAPTEGDCDGVIAFRDSRGPATATSSSTASTWPVLGHFEGNIWDEETWMNARLHPR